MMAIINKDKEAVIMMKMITNIMIDIKIPTEMDIDKIAILLILKDLEKRRERTIFSVPFVENSILPQELTAGNAGKEKIKIFKSKIRDIFSKRETGIALTVKVIISPQGENVLNAMNQIKNMQKIQRSFTRKIGDVLNAMNLHHKIKMNAKAVEGKKLKEDQETLTVRNVEN